MLERAVLLAEQGVIGPEHLATSVRPSAAALPDAPDLAPARCGRWKKSSASTCIRVLAATGGNREESSRILGISRRTLTRMIQRWGLPPRHG